MRYLFFEEKSCTEIKQRLYVVSGDSSPSTLNEKFNEFQRVRTLVFHEQRSGASEGFKYMAPVIRE